ncbi:hypothetical protein ATE40_001300 [Serratia surfactantfaciens]|nr:hypothetical protein ATE40_001300 [Serratia surfactantfaciens]
MNDNRNAWPARGFLALLAVTPAASGYDLPFALPSFVPQSLEVDVQYDYPSKWHAYVNTVQTLGSSPDSVSGALWGNAECDRDESCLTVRASDGRTTRRWLKKVRKCLPTQGPGWLSEAVSRFVHENFDNSAMEYLGEYTVLRTSNDLQICIGDGSWPYSLGYSEVGSPTQPITCSLRMPGQVDLGVIATSVSREVLGTISCRGTSETDVRISINGPSTIQPVPGLELWTTTPEWTTHVTGDGNPVGVTINVGADIRGPAPGPYSGVFVYQVEYP